MRSTIPEGMKMINNREELLRPLAQNLTEVFKNVVRCKICGTLKSKNNLCDNCENKIKKFNKICIVENISDQWAIESSSIFQGYFHILGGTLSNNSSQNKEDLLINSLVERIKRDNIEEVIIDSGVTKGTSQPIIVHTKNKSKTEKTSAA